MSGVLHGVVASLKAAAAAATDTFWKYVTLLLNTTSTNGAQNNTFLDSSTNNFTVTRNGDTTQGSFNPYMPTGYWSGYFDGTGDYLTYAPSTSLAFGTGDFTVECWSYATIAASGGAGMYLVDARTSIVTNAWALGYRLNGTGTGNLVGWFNGSTVLEGAAAPINQWNHVVYVRSGTTGSLYLNGSRIATQTDSTNYSSTGATTTIAARNSLVDYYFGYISNLRAVKGTAVYDPTQTTLTVPTTPLTAITNTSLLCLQDNRFIDNSANAFTITRNGDTRISKFAPFNPPASYSTASYGGSGYFDGNGDFLTAPDNAALNMGTSDFTLEAWVYLTATPGGASPNNAMIINKDGQNLVTWAQYTLSVTSGLKAVFAASAVPNATGAPTASITGATTLALNTWYHIAATRVGANATLWVNGVSDGTTASVPANLTNGARPLYIGYENGQAATYYFPGYISNARVVKGTAVYTTNFIPPTAPLTAITNTSLLLNFTNAGIYDAATINNGQTVADAQVSTTQAKWGTTSMRFDGTGDEVSIIAKPELRFGTAPFTVEMWVYCTNAASGATQDLVGNLTNVAGDTNWHFSISSAAVLQAGTYNNVLANSGAATLSSTTWTHVAFTFDGTTYRVFINGTVGTTTSTTVRNLSDSTSAIKVGNTNFGGRLFNGYIQDLRITNGYARYTANFTPPTAAFPTL